MKKCKLKHEPKIEVEYDTGSLNKKDVYFLCEQCNELKKFRDFRIRERLLGDNKID